VAAAGSIWMAGGVRIIIFDFDQTLSCVHVFKSLAGWGEGRSQQRGLLRVPRPFACTERGQVRRIEELNRTEPFHAEGFARVAFGGEQRVEELRRFLSMLANRGVELIICTKGLVGAAKKCLSDLRLLDFFSEVYGNVGGDAYGDTGYDRAAARAELSPEESALLGSSLSGSWRTKTELIGRLLVQRRLRPQQAVLVEDDPEEIRKASTVCRTHWVREAEGMILEDFAALVRLCGGVGQEPLAPEGGSSAAALQPSSPAGSGIGGLGGGVPGLMAPGRGNGRPPPLLRCAAAGGGSSSSGGGGGGGGSSRPGSGERGGPAPLLAAGGAALVAGSSQVRGRCCSLPAGRGPSPLRRLQPRPRIGRDISVSASRGGL